MRSVRCVMISTQLGRTLLAGSSPGGGSDDQQVATPDDRGSYDELTDAIDRVIDEVVDG